MSTVGGIAARSDGRVAITRPTVSITFAPGCLSTISRTAGLPFAQAPRRAFSAPSTAWPMSRTRTGAPLR